MISCLSYCAAACQLLCVCARPSFRTSGVMEATCPLQKLDFLLFFSFGTDSNLRCDKTTLVSAGSSRSRSFLEAFEAPFHFLPSVTGRLKQSVVVVRRRRCPQPTPTFFFLFFAYQSILGGCKDPGGLVEEVESSTCTLRLLQGQSPREVPLMTRR